MSESEPCIARQAASKELEQGHRYVSDAAHRLQVCRPSCPSSPMRP